MSAIINASTMPDAPAITFMASSLIDKRFANILKLYS